MDEQANKLAEEAAAFQKIWLETMSRMMQAACTISPNSSPPEIMRQVRTGIFQALAASWDEFMRSPQFLEGVRQWMENAISFRKLTNDFMARVRTELQAPSRADIDSVMLTVRHMEKRFLDRLDELSAEVADLKQEAGGRQAPPQKAAPTPGHKRGRLSVQRITANGKKTNA
jgi:hypothetical protein